MTNSKVSRARISPAKKMKNVKTCGKLELKEKKESGQRKEK